MPTLSTGLRSPFQTPLRAPFAPGATSILQRALSILRRPNIEAHLFLPGIGNISGLQAANYLLSDGSTGPTTVDGVTGLVLDAMGSVGVELVTNGDFSAGATGWSLGAGWSVANGKATHTAGTGSLITNTSGVSTTSGKTYQVECTISGCTAGSIQFDTSGVTSPLSTSGFNGRYFAFVVPSATSTPKIWATTTFDGAVTNISVREVTGIHATQPTTAAKPRLERGLRNLLTYSQDFSNAAWNTPDLTEAKTQENQSGTANSAWLITDGGGGTSSLAPLAAITVNQTSSFTVSRIVKYGNNTWVRFVLATTGGDGYQVWVNMLTGAKGMEGYLGAGSNGVASVTPTTNGFYNVIISCTPSGASTALTITSYATSANTVTTRVVGATYVIESAGLFQGTLTAQQILAEGGIPLTTTAAASNPSAGKYSWAFDGNDSLSLGSVPFQMSDDFAIIACARADVVSNSPDVFSQASTASANPLVKLGFDSFGKPMFALRDDAGTLALLADPGVSRQFITCTLSGRKVGNLKALRVNGLEVLTNNTAMGATTFTGAAVGVRQTSVLANYLTGSTGPIIDIKGTLSDSEMLTLERLATSLTPNGPTF